MLHFVQWLDMQQAQAPGQMRAARWFQLKFWIYVIHLSMNTLYKSLSEVQMADQLVSNIIPGSLKQGGKGNQRETHRSLHLFQGELFTSLS